MLSSLGWQSDKLSYVQNIKEKQKTSRTNSHLPCILQSAASPIEHCCKLKKTSASSSASLDKCLVMVIGCSGWALHFGGGCSHAPLYLEASEYY